MRSTAELRVLWAPPCRGPFAQIRLYGGGVLTVNPRTVAAWLALDACLRRFGYAATPPDVGAYACRRITNGVGYSLHAYGIAGDINWNCLTGDTRIITWDGPRPIGDLAGTTQRLLTRDPERGGGATWVDAPIRSFGFAPTVEVVVSRRGICKTVRTTEAHRWWHVHGFAQQRHHWRNREITSAELHPGHRLLGCLPAGPKGTLVSSVGVAAGNVYGDGARGANRDSLVDLFGPAVELLRFYPEPNVRSTVTSNGVVGLHVTGLPGFFKDPPPLDESASYLLGWLAGYFAADGCVTARGGAVLTASNRDDLDLFRLVAMRVGIGCGPPRMTKREGYGGGTGEKWTLHLLPSTVPERFFVRSDQASRFTARARRSSDHLWTVEEVREGTPDEVFCPTVESTGVFALEDWLLTGNSNPYGPVLVTDMPRSMIDAILAIRTRSGVPVFRWGGYFPGNKDGMHFEINASPAELATGIDPATVPGSAPSPAPQSEEDEIMGVKDDIINAIARGISFATEGTKPRAVRSREQNKVWVLSGAGRWFVESGVRLNQLYDLGVIRQDRGRQPVVVEQAFLDDVPIIASGR